MVLHLKKLCVGCDSIIELERWIEENRILHHSLADGLPSAQPFRQVHTTRRMPRRAAELIDGGSLYWIIKGRLAARQRILVLESFTDDEGIARTRIVLDSSVVKVQGGPCRPFQGWRYLDPIEAPPDVTLSGGDMSENLRAALATLGLL